jgi:hypothetical protein
MGPEVPVIVLIGMVVPMVLMGFILYWRVTHLDRDRIESLWAAYARGRGLDFVPAAGEWPNRSAPAVQWREPNARFRIEARGAEAFVSTGVVAHPVVPVLGELTIRRATAGDVDAVLTGDPLIDATFLVRASPRELAGRVLTPDVKRALLGFDVGQRGSLVYQSGTVRLSWAGAEENDARLDEARAVVRRVVVALGGGKEA